MIFGHTDAKPPTKNLAKTYPSNWELSAVRAATVARYLQSKALLEGHRLLPVGSSFYDPIADNDTAKGRTKNRRIDLLISNGA